MLTLSIPKLEEFLEKGKYVPPVNTPKTSLIDEIKELKEYLKGIYHFLYYIFHPKEIVMIFWSWTVEHSYLICLLLCCSGVFLYFLNCKKGSRLIKGGVISYTFIQVLNLILK